MRSQALHLADCSQTFSAVPLTTLLVILGRLMLFGPIFQFHRARSFSCPDLLFPKMAQEGWKTDKDETDCQVPEAPILCINNCGFFGSAATMNLCSKCFRELNLMKNVSSFSPKSGAEMSHDISIQIPDFVQQVQLPFPSASPAVPVQTTDGAGTSISNIEPELQHPPHQTNRCFSCNKRVGLTGFKCRCGHTFCPQHRYSDKHSCTFDYKAAGREAIAKANPVVKAEKIEKI